MLDTNENNYLATTHEDLHISNKLDRLTDHYFKEFFYSKETENIQPMNFGQLIKKNPFEKDVKFNPPASVTSFEKKYSKCHSNLDV